MTLPVKRPLPEPADHPDRVVVHRALLSMSSVKPPFDEAIGYIFVLRNRFGLDIDKTDPQYAQFLASAACQCWKAGSP